MLRMNLAPDGRIKELGYSDAYQYPAPTFISFDNTNVRCINVSEINNPASWQPVPIDPVILKTQDIEFGNQLLLEFLTGQRDIALDNATYRAVSETFKYAEAALRRGDIPQAKTELTAIALSDPVWTQEAKDYFIGKINMYLET